MRLVMINKQEHPLQNLIIPGSDPETRRHSRAPSPAWLLGTLNSTQAVPAKNSIKFTYFSQRIFQKQDPYFDSFARSTFNSIRKGLQIQQIPRKKGNAGGTKM